MKKWLKNAEAAELFGVDARTIKRWMKNPARRKALGAVRHGSKQWRIPRPDDEYAWAIQTVYRLKAAGITLKPHWERELEKRFRQNNYYLLESYRLWLAAHLQLSVKPETVTEEDITAILNLWQTACKILESLPEGTEVGKLKSQFPTSLRANNFSEERIKSIMSYWPDKSNFKKVPTCTLRELEKIRRGMDTAQSVRTCKNRGKKPTAENLRPLFHKNIMVHINDTKDELPPHSIKANTSKELREAANADFWRKKKLFQSEITKAVFAADNPDETKKALTLPSVPLIDLRKPQNGLALRTFRSRHPLKKSPLKAIINVVYDVQNNIPFVDEMPRSGKTPIRGSKLSENSD